MGKYIAFGAFLCSLAAQGAQIATEATEPTVSRKTYETEVCVVGGGMAGICASVAAARNGAKVVLVQDRPMLGGNASSEIRVPVSSAYGYPLGGGKVLENREGGLIEEIRLENIYRNPSCNWQVWDHVLWNFCAREKNLTVLLNTSVMECATNANRIVSVTGWDSISYTRVTVKADVFIDCSGDGILRLSGAAWMKGRESRRDFGESYAPEEGNLTVMGTTLMVFSEPSGVAADFSAPPETAKPYASPQHAFDGTKDVSWTCGTLEWGGEPYTRRAFQVVLRALGEREERPERRTRRRGPHLGAHVRLFPSGQARVDTLHRRPHPDAERPSRRRPRVRGQHRARRLADG